MKLVLSPEVRSFLSTLHALSNEFEAYLRRPEVREAISRLVEVLREEERRRTGFYLPPRDR